MKVAVICLVLFGLIAAVCAAVLIGALARPVGPAVPTAMAAEKDIEIMTASRDLQPLNVVTTADVVKKKIPRSQVPENALLNSVQIVGKILTDKMVANQAFTKACFAREGTGLSLATALPPGKRAMSIQLTDWSGMAGLLYPGSVVDVVISFKAVATRGQTPDSESLATTLLQGLQVLAIGSQSVADEDYKDKDTGALAQRGQINFRMITLLVDPKQAEILQLAMEGGTIALAMRNPLDSSQETRRLTRAREINPLGVSSGPIADDSDPFADPPPAPPAVAKAETASATGPASKPAPEGWETIIVRGKESQTRLFPSTTDSEESAPDGTAKPGSSRPQSVLQEEPVGSGQPG